MAEAFLRVIQDLLGRLDGPLTMRLILQPAMASLFAFRDGRNDAGAGRPAYFWSLFTEPARRRGRLLEAWKAIGKVFVIAVVLDSVYQVIVFQRIYPVEALLVAALLAFVPYLLLRGPFNRLTRLFLRQRVT